MELRIDIHLFMRVYAGFNKAAGCFGALNEILGSQTYKLGCVPLDLRENEVR
jgi:hypothetical protein